MVEAAGIEPASESVNTGTSTSVAPVLFSRARSPPEQGSVAQSPIWVSRNRGGAAGVPVARFYDTPYPFPRAGKGGASRYLRSGCYRFIVGIY